MIYRKLVRDKIPEIIERDGKLAKVHVADEEEYRQSLNEKLLEEVLEFLDETNEEELADVLEVLEAMAKLCKLDFNKARTIQEIKSKERGSFQERIILDETI